MENAPPKRSGARDNCICWPKKIGTTTSIGKKYNQMSSERRALEMEIQRDDEWNGKRNIQLDAFYVLSASVDSVCLLVEKETALGAQQ